MLQLDGNKINKMKLVSCYLKKKGISFDERDKYDNMSISELEELISSEYNVKGNVNWQSLQKAKKIDSIPLEHDEQVAVIKWCKENKYPCFAVPNGFITDLGYKYINYLVAEGYRKGAPDLVVFKGDGVSIYIEMKRRIGGRMSEQQKIWAKWLLDNGYNYICANGSEEAINFIKSI